MRIKWVLALALLAPAIANAGVTLTASAPGVETSSVANPITETFNGFSAGNHATLTTALGDFQGNTPIAIVPADDYGGAGGTGNYAAIGEEVGIANGEPTGTSTATLTFNSPQTYFGFWLSALDLNNEVELFNGSLNVETINQTTVNGLINIAYYGNASQGGADNTQAFVYLNFFATGSTKFTSVEFLDTNNVQGNVDNTGFEFDNLTISAPLPSAVWGGGALIALLAVGTMLRRRTA